MAAALAARSCRTSRPAARAVRARFGIGADVRLGLGVERWDFTKGIIERFLALEALLDKDPRLTRAKSRCCRWPRPRAASCRPTRRCRSKRYSEVERINEKFGTATGARSC